MTEWAEQLMAAHAAMELSREATGETVMLLREWSRVLVEYALDGRRGRRKDLQDSMKRYLNQKPVAVRFGEEAQEGG